MIINISNTLIGYEVGDWWLFYDTNAQLLSRETGMQIHKAAGGKMVAGFPIKDECIYTAKLVKAGYKLQILPNHD